ncbi:MAG: glycosyltransferase [Elusimicrobiota bacterium]|nr:glycosyltransferase [Elusimicrobiota bacterium]
MTGDKKAVFKQNFLHLITSLNIGGTENFLLTLVRSLKHKYNFYVGYIKEKGLVSQMIENEGIPVIHLPNIFSIAKFIRKEQIQILHTHLYRANILGRIAGKIAHVKLLISSQRSIDNWKRKNPFAVIADRITSNFCDGIIANSLAAKNALMQREKITAEKITVIHNGVNINDFITKSSKETVKKKLNITENSYVVSCVTRLHLEKGVDLIPEIAQQVLSKNKQIVFLVVGDGPEKENLELKIKNSKLKEKILLLGWRQDVHNILSITDVFFLCSREESFPQSVLEAMALGIPVVATNVGGIKEIVQDSKTGFLVNNTSEFAEKILKLINNPELRNSFSLNAKQIAAQYTTEKMIYEIDAFYSYLITHI